MGALDTTRKVHSNCFGLWTVFHGVSSNLYIKFLTSWCKERQLLGKCFECISLLARARALCNSRKYISAPGKSGKMEGPIPTFYGLWSSNSWVAFHIARYCDFIINLWFLIFGWGCWAQRLSCRCGANHAGAMNKILRPFWNFWGLLGALEWQSSPCHRRWSKPPRSQTCPTMIQWRSGGLGSHIISPCIPHLWREFFSLPCVRGYSYLYFLTCFTCLKDVLKPARSTWWQHQKGFVSQTYTVNGASKFKVLKPQNFALGSWQNVSLKGMCTDLHSYRCCGYFHQESASWDAKELCFLSPLWKKTFSPLWVIFCQHLRRNMRLHETV